jgi:hypothetical protein
MEKFSFNKGNASSSLKRSPSISFSKIPAMPKFKINKKLVLGIFGGLIGVLVVVLLLGYFFIVMPLMNIASQAKELKASTFTVRKGVEDMNLTQTQAGLDNLKTELEEFKVVYEKNMRNIRRLPRAELYYQDSQHLIAVAEDSLDLGYLAVDMVEPYAEDLGFSTDSNIAASVPAQERVIKLMRLMPQFSSRVEEIASKMQAIDNELAKIDASRYPTKLPRFVKYIGVEPETNIREYILSVQSISKELSAKAPQMTAFFNAVPDFMGLNTPKRYLILMANNYELRMSGGFNTYIVGVEFKEGIPDIFFSIDTYFIDEGDRTGNSNLVNRNVPYHLRNYLYLSGNTFRWYARDATSNSADFPTAVNDLLTGFWRKDRTLPQNINGVIQINNDLAVDILRAVGPVNTEKYSIKRDDGTYITIPVTEFNADNVIEELETIAGGKLAQTIGRKEIIKYLGQSILTKMYTSEATNLLNITKVILDSLSKKDIKVYSFDANVEKAFDDLGYSGKIIPTSTDYDYLHVNRSNYGSGKADWTKPGFVSQEVTKSIEIKDGKKISTVNVKIKNPARPDWYNIDPCCFYRAYRRVYVPIGSKMLSVTASDGQDARGAQFDDLALGKTYIESFTTQPKQTDLTITYVYELPDTVNLDDYRLVLQRQSGTTIDPYNISVEGVGEELLLNSDKVIAL